MHAALLMVVCLVALLVVSSLDFAIWLIIMPGLMLNNMPDRLVALHNMPDRLVALVSTVY